MSGFTNIMLASGSVTIPANILPDLNLVTPTYFSLFGQDAGETELDELSSLDFKPDGTKFWIMCEFCGGVPQIVEYDMLTPWDITTAVYNSSSAQIGDYGPTQRYQQFQWKDDGTSLYICAFTGRQVDRFDVSTPYTMDWLANPTPDQTFDVSSDFTGNTLVGLTMFTDGTRMFLSGYNNIIAHYTLSTPWDLTTASLANKTGALSPSFGTIAGNTVSRDGLQVWAVGATNDRINQWTMTTPFNFSELSGAPSATFDLQNGPGFSNTKTVFVPPQRNEMYVGWYGVGPTTTFIEKYTW